LYKFIAVNNLIPRVFASYTSPQPLKPAVLRVLSYYDLHAPNESIVRVNVLEFVSQPSAKGAWLRLQRKTPFANHRS
jgi:hypothetical protein